MGSKIKQKVTKVTKNFSELLCGHAIRPDSCEFAAPWEFYFGRGLRFKKKFDCLVFLR
jgi:hypothetical protein